MARNRRSVVVAGELWDRMIERAHLEGLSVSAWVRRLAEAELRGGDRDERDGHGDRQGAAVEPSGSSDVTEAGGSGGMIGSGDASPPARPPLSKKVTRKNPLGVSIQDMLRGIGEKSDE